MSTNLYDSAADQVLATLMPAELHRITVQVPISDTPVVERMMATKAGKVIVPDRIEAHTGFTSPSFPGLAVIAFTRDASPTVWSTTHIESGLSLLAPGNTLEANLVYAVLAGRLLDWSKVHADERQAFHEDPAIDPLALAKSLRDRAFGIHFVLGEPDVDAYLDDDDLDMAGYYEDEVRDLLDSLDVA